MKEQVISRAAVIILAIVMAVFGIYHFNHAREMIVFVPDFLPGGITWVYVIGVAFILVAVALLFHKGVKIAGYTLAILLFLFVLLIHLPNWRNAGDAEMRTMAFMNLLKDSAIAAFAMYVAANAQKI